MTLNIINRMGSARGPHKLFTLILTLAACSTPQQRAHQKAHEERAYRAALEQRCASYGFRRGTDAFAFCVSDAHLCEQQHKERAFAYNLALLRNNKPGSTYLSNSAAAAREVGPAPICR